MYKLRKHVLCRRFFTGVLILLIVWSCFPVKSFGTVEWRPGTKVYFSQGPILKGSDTSGKGNRCFYHDPSKYTNRWPNSTGTAWLKENCYSLSSPIHSYKISLVGGGTGKIAYCLEQNVRNPASGNTRYTADAWKDSPFVGRLYSETVQKGILLTLLYGRQPDSGASDIEKLFGISGANLDDWYAATQTLIWEYQQGLRTSAAGGRKSYGITKPDYFYTIVKGRKAGEIYNAMLKQMKNHETVPSFTGKENKNLTPVRMSFDESSGLWKSQILTDSKRCGQNFRVMASVDKDDPEVNQKISIVRQGDSNQYVIETSLNPEEWNGRSFRGKKDVPQINREDLLTWNANDGTHYQTLATGADDPVNFYFKLTKEEVKEPGEAPEPELPSFSFDVEKRDKNPGFDQESGSSSTGMGDAALDSEISLYVGGELEDVRQLGVNGQSDEPFFFVPWSDISELNVEKIPHYDKEGNLQYTEYVYTGEKEVYTEETAVPDGRFSEKKSGTGEGIRSHGIIRYEARCTDQPTGPEYRITYEGEEGSRVTVTDPDLVSPQEPLAMQDDKNGRAFVNDNFRGTLQIVKTRDDQDPFTDKENSDNGVKDYSTGSRWTIRLKSGGFEDCPYIRVVRVSNGEAGYDQFAETYRVVRDSSGVPADSDNPLTVSPHGQIRVLDLPYGTYTVSEITADAYGYVLESFEVTVSEDGQLISREINNKAKANRIKIIKTNSETGKTVRWDADRTAFRIKYLGNPALEHPENAENAGRYLPNGSGYTDESQNYVFYADKNGEIVLPYDIEYGNYLIEELTVPAGYYVGSYDSSGKGTIADMGKVEIVDHQGKPVTPPKGFTETVQVRDGAGNRVERFSGDSDTTYNTYGFTVLEQDPHISGEDYILYYAVIDMPNNPVKGKLQIIKDGQSLAGWNRRKDDPGIWFAVWGKSPLAGSRFEIYAAQDIVQSDGVIPVKVFSGEEDKEIRLKEVSRDHADAERAEEVREHVFEDGSFIRRTSSKNAGINNITVTDYFLKAEKGASYEENFSVRDEEKKLTYSYSVKYGLNYAKGGFNYTDVYVKKTVSADDYAASLPVTEPVLKSGDMEVGFVTMNYDGGNRVRMNRLDGESPEEYTGVQSGYNSDDITADVVLPLPPVPVFDEETGEPEVDEEGNQVFQDPIPLKRPEGWKEVKDEDGNRRSDCYMVTSDGDCQILVSEKGELRWIPCTEDGRFYKSHSQTYHFTTAQHYDSEDGFSFSWDSLIHLETRADHEAEKSVTVIDGYDNGTPDIFASDIYTFEKDGNRTVFTGQPQDKASVYFLTNDGIRSEMMLSGGLAHTRLTVAQSQLKKFSKTLPVIQYRNEEEWETIQWSSGLKPGNNDFEKIFDDSNYIKAERHEVGETNREVYYTIDIVSDNSSEEDGFRITYPDTTQAVPKISSGGRSAVLSFSSVDDTMVYPVGKAVETVTTDEKGQAESSLLSLGEYWIREVCAGPGHVNSGRWKKMKVSWENQYTPLIWASESFENQAVSVRIDLEKLFETGYGTGQYGPGNGAVFGIFTAENIEGTAKSPSDQEIEEKILPKDSPVGSMTVVEGQASVAVKLPMGKYYIKEISAPQGYRLNTARYYFDVTDVLTADQMSFRYKSLGVSGFLTQNGNEEVRIDFDTLYRYSSAAAVINGKTYSMSENAEDENVTISVMDGRTNASVLVQEEKPAVIEWENGSVMTVKSDGQSYIVYLEGPLPEELQTGPSGNENFSVSAEEGRTVISYSPKVTKTNWFSEVTYPFEEAEETLTEEEKAKKTVLKLTSPQRVLSVEVHLDDLHDRADIYCPEGKVESVCVNEEAVTDPDAPISVKRGDKAAIVFAGDVTFMVELDEKGDFYMSAAGACDNDLKNRSTLTVDGSEELPETVRLKNTTAKTYARNNSAAEILNITVSGIKNDRLPQKPDKPDKPEEPNIPDKPKGSICIIKVDSDTGASLEGAEFEIWSSKTADGKLVPDSMTDCGKTGKDGKLVVKDLAYGHYFFREVKAPKGYETDGKFYQVTLDEENRNETVTVQNQKQAEEKPVTGRLRILKEDSKDGRPLTGAVFEIADQTYGVIFTGKTDKDGILLTDELKEGKYFYREIKAPDGYIRDNEYHSFYITENEATVEVTVQNQPEPVTKEKTAKDIPQTGDSQSLMLYLILTMLTVSGTVAGVKRMK